MSLSVEGVSSGFQPKFCTHFSLCPCVLYARPVSCFYISSS
jgi:hypothetical protein